MAAMYCGENWSQYVTFLRLVFQSFQLIPLKSICSLIEDILLFTDGEKEGWTVFYASTPHGQIRDANPHLS